MAIMKGITIKLPETTLRRLRQEARATGRSVAALTSDLAGSVAGGRKAATNERRKFSRP